MPASHGTMVFQGLNCCYNNDIKLCDVKKTNSRDYKFDQYLGIFHLTLYQRGVVGVSVHFWTS